MTKKVLSQKILNEVIKRLPSVDEWGYKEYRYLDIESECCFIFEKQDIRIQFETSDGQTDRKTLFRQWILKRIEVGLHSSKPDTIS